MDDHSDTLTGLDVYARPFVPKSLEQVNLVPAQIVPSVPPPGFDYATYIQSFAGADFLSSATSTAGLEATSTTPPSFTLPVANGHQAHIESNEKELSILHPRNYGSYFEVVLHKENRALRREYSDHSLYRVFILPA
jgi:helicase MOV-10